MTFKETGKKIAGWTVISVGILGLVLPLIPGILLIALGSTMIGSKFIPMRIEKARQSFKIGFRNNKH